MQKIKYITYILSSLLLLSCGEDFFDSIVEVDVPAHTPNLAVTAHLTNLDEVSLVHVTQTLGILDNANAIPINDAVVELYGAGELVQTYEYRKLYEEQGDNGNILVRDFYVIENPKPLAFNTNYELRVSSPTFGEIQAVQQLASPISILEAKYEDEGIVDIYGERGNELSIKFKDEAGKKNYYAVRATAFFEFDVGGGMIDTFGVGLYLSPADPSAEDGENVLLLPDATFDGKEYELKMATFQDMEEATSLTVTLFNITEDRYLYEKSILSYDENDGNPFAEPVIIHENISNGNGIFTVSAGATYEIQF